jgi:tetratricopeptide (TPR) repeat protein
LSGIPLAIELAAARVNMLSLEEIVKRLGDRFRLLVDGGRITIAKHQTLRATMDWSYELLGEQERILFQRLSVFAGGLSLEAAEVVCSGEKLNRLDILNLVGHLVDKSLVSVDAQIISQSGQTRYRLQETIRAYAHEKLDDSGETERLRQQHRDYFIAFAEQAEPKLKSAEQFDWLDRLEAEHDNLRAAWECAIESDADLALRLASALLDFWSMRVNPGEGRLWLAELIDRTNQWGSTAKRAHVLGVAGRLAYLQRDFASSRSLLEAALAIARKAGDQKEIAYVLLWLGWTAHRQRDDQTAEALAEECLAIYQQLQNRWGMAMAIYRLADVLASQGQYAEAEERYMNSLATFREIGDKFRAGYVLNGLGELARLQGDYVRAGKFYEEHIEILREQRSSVALVTASVNEAWVSLYLGDYPKARALFEESLRLSSEYSNKIALMDCLAGFAGVFGMSGKPERAARLFGGVEALLERSGMRGGMDPADQKEIDHYVTHVRSQLDETVFTRAWSEGQALTLDQAIEYALADVRE